MWVASTESTVTSVSWNNSGIDNKQMIKANIPSNGKGLFPTLKCCHIMSSTLVLNKL